VRAVIAVLLLIAGCGDNVRDNISLDVPAPWLPAFNDFVEFADHPDLTFGTSGDFRIQIVEDPAVPVEGYRIDRSVTGLADEMSITFTVAARDLLGAQYGASAALEHLGFRFRHPFDTYVPRVPQESAAQLGVVHQPQVRVRGFQLHTLHPIEAYYAFWEPSPGSTDDAHRIIDWLIKNRGNYVQWLPLDNIMDAAEHAKWKPFTQELVCTRARHSGRAEHPAVRQLEPATRVRSLR
jgi:hypothetical protein